MTHEKLNKANEIMSRMAEIKTIYNSCKYQLVNEESIQITPSAYLPLEMSKVLLEKAIEMLRKEAEDLDKQFQEL